MLLKSGETSDAHQLRTTFNNDLKLIKKDMYNYFNGHSG